MRKKLLEEFQRRRNEKEEKVRKIFKKEGKGKEEE